MAQSGEVGGSAILDDGRVEVTIDGQTVRVPRGTLLLDAASQLGIHIPIYCAHPKMDPVAVCRMCLVQVEKMPKLQPACATYVTDGMVVHTATEQVAKAREGILEFLLLNHPLDCPVCDRGGECDLQDFAFRYGPEVARMPITDKVHFPKAVPLSPHIELDQERCILCWRCVRYYEEITGEKEIVLEQRGVQTVVATFQGQPLQSRFQGNLPEICPVGALTHRQYRFQARPWDLQRTPGICPECSYGCNVYVDTREFAVKRFASRDNPLVDDMWLCDRGRYSAPSWNDLSRVRSPVIRDARGSRQVDVGRATEEAALLLRAIRDEHGGNSIGVIGSPMLTNEELWSLQRLARELLGTPHLDHQLEAFVGLIPEEHDLGIAEIEQCSTVVVLGSRPEDEAPVLTLRLYKAERKYGTRVHRVASDTDPDAVARLIGDGETAVGLLADESERNRAAQLVASLSRRAPTRRLTVTRGVNGRGAKDLGVLPNLLPGYRPAPGAGKTGGEMLQAAAAGRLRALLLVDAERVLRMAPRELAEAALRGVEVVVALEPHPGLVSEAASVLLPGHILLEKGGTVTNLEGRVQRLRPALPPATAVPVELRILGMLAAHLGGGDWPGDTGAAHRQLAQALPAYADAGIGGRARFASPSAAAAGVAG